MDSSTAATLLFAVSAVIAAVAAVKGDVIKRVHLLSAAVAVAAAGLVAAFQSVVK